MLAIMASGPKPSTKVLLSATAGLLEKLTIGTSAARAISLTALTLPP